MNILEVASTLRMLDLPPVAVNSLGEDAVEFLVDVPSGMTHAKAQLMARTLSKMFGHDNTVVCDFDVGAVTFLPLDLTEEVYDDFAGEERGGG
jgi:hypothetical protein